MNNLLKYFYPFKKPKTKVQKKTKMEPLRPVSKPKKPPSIRFAQWQAESLEHHKDKHNVISKLYSPYQAPPGVRGSVGSGSQQHIVMDSSLSSAPGIAEWAGEGMSHSGILQAAFNDGLVFLGYPTLAEMANRPELRKPCHVIAREALREWIHIQMTGNAQDKNRIKEIEQEFERLGVRHLLQRMAEQSLLYGISHLWINIEGETLNSDGQSLPLSHTKNGLAKNALKELRLIEPIWMTPHSYRADNPLQNDYYKPEHWWVQGILVHQSRLLQMVPYEVSDLLKPAFNFGGLSLTQQLKPYAHNYLRIRNSVANIVANFSKLVLQTDMAANMTAPDDDIFGNMIDASSLTGRAKLLQALSEGQDTIIADKESEDIKIVSAPLGGLDHLQAQSMEAQAAIPGIPLVKLFGVTPTGLNASSEGEIRVFYDEIKSFQQANLRPVLERIFKLCQINLWGEIDPSLSFEFCPLWQLDPQEKTALEKSKADIDAQNIKNNIISPQEARERQQAEKDSIYAGINLSKSLPASKPEMTSPSSIAQDGEWDESKHPRNRIGEFTNISEESDPDITRKENTDFTGKLTHAIGAVANFLNPIGTANAAPGNHEIRKALADERSAFADKKIPIEAFHTILSKGKKEELENAKKNAAEKQAKLENLQAIFEAAQKANTAPERLKELRKGVENAQIAAFKAEAASLATRQNAPHFLTDPYQPAAKQAAWLTENTQGPFFYPEIPDHPHNKMEPFETWEANAPAPSLEAQTEHLQNEIAAIHEAWAEKGYTRQTIYDAPEHAKPDAQRTKEELERIEHEQRAVNLMQQRDSLPIHAGTLKENDGGTEILLPKGYHLYHEEAPKRQLTIKRKRSVLGLPADPTQAGKGEGETHIATRHGWQIKDFGSEEKYVKFIAAHYDAILKDPAKGDITLLYRKEDENGRPRKAPNGEILKENQILKLRPNISGHYLSVLSAYPTAENFKHLNQMVSETNKRSALSAQNADLIKQIQDPEIRAKAYQINHHFYFDPLTTETHPDGSTDLKFEGSRGQEALQHHLQHIIRQQAQPKTGETKTFSAPHDTSKEALSAEEMAHAEKVGKIIDNSLSAAEYAGIFGSALVPGAGEAVVPAELAAKQASAEVQKKLSRTFAEKAIKFARNFGHDPANKLPDTPTEAQLSPETNNEIPAGNAEKISEPASSTGKNEPASWENEKGELIGNKGNKHTIREIKSQKNPEEDAQEFIEKTRQHLIKNGYKSQGKERLGKDEKKFKSEIFNHDDHEIRVNTRRDNASGKKTPKDTITVDIHNHPDILNKYNTKTLKFKFLP